jgi:hypothetical protein
MTYICQFCKTKMHHQPDNNKVTTLNNLIAKVGDTFKCECSIRQEDSDGKVWNLNSWKVEEDGWYHLGSTDGNIIFEKFPTKREWTKEREPFSNIKEKVVFT